MSIELEVSAAYIDVAHDWNENDIDFYKNLPNVHFEFLNPHTGRAEIPRPDIKQTLMVFVTAVMSSTVLSQAIESYLQKQPTRIEITIEKNKDKSTLVFE